MGGGKKTDVIISRGLELWLEEEGHKIKSSFFVSLWQAGAFFYSKGVYFLLFLFGKTKWSSYLFDDVFKSASLPPPQSKVHIQHGWKWSESFKTLSKINCF